MSFTTGQRVELAPAFAANPAAAVAGRRRHLSAALAAVLSAAACLGAIHVYVGALLPGRLADFASRTSPVKLSGNVLQACAFSTPHEMPIYGSSELDRAAPNRPDAFFRNRPTGFAVFPIGRGGTTCLMLLQKIAAAGKVVRGRKTAVFLSPTWFSKEEVGENAVDGNLTPAQVGAWIFDSPISASLKDKIALRLQDYPSSLEHEPLLTAALGCRARPTFGHRLLLRAITPIGWLQNLIYQQLEYCSIWREISKYPAVPTASAGVGPAPDWSRLAQAAERQERTHDQGIPFSPVVSRQDRNVKRLEKASPRTVRNRDAEFAAKMLDSREWEDLGLLMAGLRELGVQAVFIAQPFNGVYRDEGGTTPAGRRPYYEKLAQVISAGGFPLQDYPEHEEDRFFFNDSGHPSAKAWIYYDRSLDQFYRGLHP